MNINLEFIMHYENKHEIYIHYILLIVDYFSQSRCSDHGWYNIYQSQMSSGCR